MNLRVVASSNKQAELSATVTLRDIAERSGYSKFTVSHALRGNRSQVSEDTLQHITRVARDMGYDPNTAYQARRLAMRRNGKQPLNQLIGLFFPVQNIELPYFRQFLTGIAGALRKSGFNLLLNCTPTEDALGELMPMMGRGDVDGLIVMANLRGFQRIRDKLRALPGFRDRPIVTVVDSLAGCSGVVTDDRAGMAEAVGHLLDLGHRRIVHFWPPKQVGDTVARRLRGAADACCQRGLSPDDVLIAAKGWDQNERAAAFADLQRALADHPDATAVLARNDRAAVWTVEFLQQLGRRVPEDVSVVGYDDTDPVWNDQHENSLTTVHVPVQQIGELAADLVVAEARKQSEQPQVKVVETSLVIRQTTGPAPPRRPEDVTP